MSRSLFSFALILLFSHNFFAQQIPKPVTELDSFPGVNYFVRMSTYAMNEGSSDSLHVTYTWRYNVKGERVMHTEGSDDPYIGTARDTVVTSPKGDTVTYVTQTPGFGPRKEEDILNEKGQVVKVNADLCNCSIYMSYDNAGRRIAARSEYMYVTNVDSFFYNAAGKLVANWQYDNESEEGGMGNTYTKISGDSFVYNDQGFLIKKLHESSYDPQEINHYGIVYSMDTTYYSYTNGMWLSREMSISSDNVKTEHEYIYGKLMRLAKYIVTDSTGSDSTLFYYDDQAFLRQRDSWKKGNKASETWITSYNSKGLPVRCVAHRENGEGMVVEWRYE